jgi:hypothetical protein
LGDNWVIVYLNAPSIGVMEAARSPISVLLIRASLIAALATAMLVGTFVCWPRMSFWQQERIARQLIAELEQSAGPQIVVVLKQVSSLGNPAIEPLVWAAASERADIALAARRIIEQEFATWQIRAEQEGQFSLAEPTALLAAALRKHVDKFGAFSQQWATRLTLDIVDLAETFNVEAAVPVLADCSTVLAAVPALGPRMLTPEVRARPPESEQLVATLPQLRVPLLPHEEANRQRIPVTSGEAVETVPTTAGPAWHTKLPQDSHWIPEWQVQAAPVAALPLPSEKEEKILTPDAPAELVNVPSPEEQAKTLETLRVIETRELFARLQGADRFETAAIREVLVERGIAAEELALAGRLFAEDVSERLKLVGDLKILPAKTARRWLRELLADEDAEVRLQALTALATTNDPELSSIARDLAIRDTDRRVAALASQIMRARR